MILEKEIIFENLNIHYRLCGDISKPPLVFLAGWGARPGMWKLLNGTDPVIEALSKYFYVISIEHPGLMRSAAPSQDWYFEDYARIVHGVLENMQITNVVLLGNSYGGAIATAYAKIYSQSLKMLILIDSVVNTDYPQTMQVTKSHNNLVQKLKSPKIPFFLKKFYLWLYCGIPFRNINPNNFSNFQKTIADAGIKRLLNVDYSKFKVPTLLFWGKKDLTIHPIDYARDIITKLPHARLIEYDGSVPTLYRKPKEMVEMIYSGYLKGI